MIFFPFFPRFPDPEFGYPDFCVVHVNQLQESFNLIGHMPYFRFFRISGSGNRKSGAPPIWGSSWDQDGPNGTPYVGLGSILS